MLAIRDDGGGHTDIKKREILAALQQLFIVYFFSCFISPRSLFCKNAFDLALVKCVLHPPWVAPLPFPPPLICVAPPFLFFPLPSSAPPAAVAAAAAAVATCLTWMD